MTSRDVIHSFFVPEFRIKQDVVPGRYTETWFEATKPGRYRIYCTEYLRHLALADGRRGGGAAAGGVRRAGWPASARAWPTGVDTSGGPTRPDSFRGDLVSTASGWPAAQGCLKCHSVDGDAAHRPHLGRPVPAPDDAGRRQDHHRRRGLPDRVDDGPYAKMVKGYAKVMPTFQGKLTAPETAALVEYIKSLRSDSSGERLRQGAGLWPSPATQRR